MQIQRKIFSFIVLLQIIFYNSYALADSPAISIDDNGGVTINKLYKSYSKVFDLAGKKSPKSLNLGKWDICYLVGSLVHDATYLACSISYAGDPTSGNLPSAYKGYDRNSWTLYIGYSNDWVHCYAQCMNIGSD